MNVLARWAAACVALLALATPLTAAAQGAYPNKPIRIVVPFPAGTSPDIVARFLAIKLGERLGQPLPVDNRAGAGGVLGAEAVAKAAPDGYTLFFMANSIVTMNQFIYKKLPYDPARDFASVSIIANVPYVLLANKDFSAKTLKDLIAMAKAQPGKVNYASYGVGGAGHVIMELLTSMAGVQLTHIPYKTNALVDVIGGQVPLILQPTTTAIEQSKKGTVIPLGSTGEKRLALLPNVPTIAEVVPGFAADGWQGMMAPAGTPPAIINRLNQEIIAVLALPETAERFAGLGIEAWPSTPKQMDTVIAADVLKWGTVIRNAKIEPQ
jgi:tripartite-type tricarboxylate transporter receptor subunit TctC